MNRRNGQCMYIVAAITCLILVGCKLGRNPQTQERAVSMEQLDERVLRSGDLRKIALYLAEQLTSQDFTEIDCGGTKHSTLVSVCFEYVGPGSSDQERINILWTEVMNKLVERGRNKFLMPDPPYAQQNYWYTTVWGIPSTRYTFDVVLARTLYIEDLSREYLELRITYSESETWDDLYPPR